MQEIERFSGALSRDALWWFPCQSVPLRETDAVVHEESTGMAIRVKSLPRTIVKGVLQC